jgi:hypothetical protein
VAVRAHAIVEPIEASHVSAAHRTLQAMRTSRPGRRSRGVVVALSAVLLLAGCSSNPAPRAWAAAVCQALTPWRAEIGTLTSRTQAQMDAKTTPVQAKENLVQLFGGAQTASEAARKGVEQAGIPEATHGEVVARSFRESLTAVRDAYGRARTGIEGLATDPSDAFYGQVADVVKQLQTDYDKSALDTTKLDSPELKQAFDEVPECR